MRSHDATTVRLVVASCLAVLLSACQAPPPTAGAVVATAVKPAVDRIRRTHPPTLTTDPVHDPTSSAARLLQRPDDALGAFPVDAYGYVDWAATLDRLLITPRSAVAAGPPAAPLDLDVVMRNTRDMPYVVFPHRAHTQWLDCGNCHPALFAPQAGTARILMEDIFRGESSGLCHGRVAFPATYTCERCHRIPHGAVKAWW